MACSVSSAAHRSQSAPLESSSSGVVAAATTTSIMLTSSGGTGSPGASTTPLHARPATSTVVDHPLRDPGGHWRPGGGDSAKRKAPDRCSINEVSEKRSGGQSRRSALSGRPLIACQSNPTVACCGTPTSNWYSTINPSPSMSTAVSAPASLRSPPLAIYCPDRGGNACPRPRRGPGWVSQRSGGVGAVKRGRGAVEAGLNRLIDKELT